ncbi:MAG: hypothetical protein NTY77_05895 [Elusimicrobia bacterium]|nr:hypothetical protein [Elusimicrobiota bacterium]
MSEPFDSAVCAKATLDDLNFDQIKWFVSSARRGRGCSIPKDEAPQALLERLHLIRDGRLTNAALILFGRDPRRLLALPPIECRHFQGPTGATVLRRLSVCDGTIFEWIFQAAFFALQGLSRPVQRWDLPPYDIPKEAVHEAVLNALVHQDYSGATGMQLMLFSDRLEISNPGALPPSLSLDQLRQAHSSVPGNPLVAQALCFCASMEGQGDGTNRMIGHCRSAGLREPVFKLKDGFWVIFHRPALRPPAPPAAQAGGQEPLPAPPPAPSAPRVPEEVRRLLMACQGEMSREQLQKKLHLKSPANFRNLYLAPALEGGFLEMTLPDKPKSHSQKYRLTAKGKAVLASSR